MPSYDLLKNMAFELDKYGICYRYVIDKELQYFDDFILCVALFTFRFVLDKIS